MTFAKKKLMKWYLVKLVFSIETEHHFAEEAQFDEQLRLINAADGSAAYAKANELGSTLSTTFPNVHGKMVHWQFINTSEVIALNEIYDGMEIYSGTIETNEKQRFITSVRQRSVELMALQTA
jgi:hypothetical protein